MGGNPLLGQTMAVMGALPLGAQALLLLLLALLLLLLPPLEEGFFDADGADGAAVHLRRLPERVRRWYRACGWDDRPRNVDACARYLRLHDESQGGERYSDVRALGLDAVREGAAFRAARAPPPPPPPGMPSSPAPREFTGESQPDQRERLGGAPAARRARRGFDEAFPPESDWAAGVLDSALDRRRRR